MNTEELSNSYRQLDYEQRQSIAIGLQQGLSMRAIARMLNRAPSSISREIARNSGGAGYACTFAQQRCFKRRIHNRPQPKLVVGSKLFEQVRTWLHLGWSPQQNSRPLG